MSASATPVNLPTLSHAAFTRRLMKLQMLYGLHFGGPEWSERVRNKLDAELFMFANVQIPEQMQHFKDSGEIAKLLRLCDARFITIFKRASEGMHNEADLFSDWFVFEPSAYALTYEIDKSKDDESDFHVVYLATPTLCALYSNTTKFESMDGVAMFIDSILIHEIAHCIGSMKHDARFKKTFKKICEAEGVKPVI